MKKKYTAPISKCLKDMKFPQWWWGALLVYVSQHYGVTEQKAEDVVRYRITKDGKLEKE